MDSKEIKKIENEMFNLPCTKCRVHVDDYKVYFYTNQIKVKRRKWHTSIIVKSSSFSWGDRFLTMSIANGNDLIVPASIESDVESVIVRSIPLLKEQIAEIIKKKQINIDKARKRNERKYKFYFGTGA